jgi:formate hydrogenlyase transcriptional activator
MDPDKRADRYRLLLGVNNAIISNLTRESLFHAISEALRAVVPFDRAVLYDSDKDVLRTFALEGRDLRGHSHAPHQHVSRHGTAVGWAFENQQPRLRSNLELESRLPGDDILLDGGVRSYLIVPLLARGRAIGALLLASFVSNRYSPDDVPLVEEVAKQIALAVDNMQAYEEISRLRGQLEAENRYLQEEIKSDYNFEEIVGQSPALKRVFKAIETVAPAGTTVLILGETGTGKELVARALHNLSARRDKALVKVNCAALPSGLIESELFGHEKGAFTGAVARKIGRFELAHGGTLFLDEIGDLPLELQPKLLRVLQEGEFERVGASDTTTVDVRVIAATNRDLETAVREGRFRPDLYYRLNVFPIRLPSLRERTEDIPLLVRYLAQRYGARLAKRIPAVSAETMDVLQAYPWPGNIRELENVIERAMILSEGAELEVSGSLPTSAGGAAGAGAGVRTLEDIQREYIRLVLEQTGWRVSGRGGAAELLGMKATTLEARMKKLGVKRTD